MSRFQLKQVHSVILHYWTSFHYSLKVPDRLIKSKRTNISHDRHVIISHPTKITLPQYGYFSELYYHKSFQDPKVAWDTSLCVHRFETTNCRKLKRRRSGVQWHTKFRENGNFCMKIG
jgi:hypothetical protein